MKRPTETAYAELQLAYDHYNDYLFDGRLPPCLITLQREKRTMGYFSSKRFVHADRQVTDEIAMNPEYFAVVPLIEVMQTLCHEACHLFQAHFGKPSRSGYHNAEWAKKMIEIGLIPSDTGAPGGKQTGQKMGDYVQPGGRFELATQALFDTGFMISWFDRFPAHIPHPTWSMLQAANVVANTPATGSHPLPLQELGTQRPASESLVFTSPALEKLGEILEPREAMQNRSHRNKYSCSSCGLSVWGKPGIRVKCGDCNFLME